MVPVTDALGFLPDGASSVALAGAEPLWQAAASKTVQAPNAESRMVLNPVFIRDTSLVGPFVGMGWAALGINIL
jgi:hypothetical protein